MCRVITAEEILCTIVQSVADIEVCCGLGEVDERNVIILISLEQAKLLTGRDSGFCTACFGGGYPTDVPSDGLKDFSSELKYLRHIGPTTIGVTPIAFASSIYLRI